MKTAIVILNYNGEKHLKRFLPSVVKYCPEEAEVIVADNASTDRSLNFLRTHYPEMKVIEMDENSGFAGGYNKALQEVESDFYVILNSDVEVTEGWLDILIREMNANPEIVACQPKIRAVNRPDYFEHAGASGGFIDKNGYPFCRGRIFDHCERDIGQHDDSREVFWATGACLVIRAAAFHEAGGFDEQLFAHMEEIDLCWRLKNRGHRIYCFPESVVYHLGGGTLSVQNPRKTYLNFRNNLSVIFRNDYRKGIIKKIIKRMIFDAGGAFYMLFTSGASHFFAVIRAHLYFYIHLGRLRKERNALRSQANAINRTGIYRGSIVQDYFKDNKRVFGALASNLFVRQNRNA